MNFYVQTKRFLGRAMVQPVSHWSVSVGCAVDKVALGQVLFRVLRFSANAEYLTLS
jgi:hypothetical protein